MRCRRVDNDSACQHHMTKLTNAFFILGVGVKHRSVTKSAIFQQSFCIVNGLFVGINLIEGQCGRKFFSGERDINTDAVDFCNQSFCISRDFYSGKFSDSNCGLTNDLCIEFSVNLDHIANCFRFFCIENVTAALDKFFFDGIVNGSHNSHRLFRSTDHTIVEGFGKQNTADCHFNIAGIIKNNRSIAGTDTNSRRSAGIGCLNHTRSAGCKDQRNVFMAHKITTHCNSRLVDPSDDVLRSSGFDCGIQHDFGGETGAFFCTRVGAEYDTVTGFESAKSFEDGCRSRIGCRNDTGNNATGFCNLDHTGCIVCFNNSTGFQWEVFVADIFGCIVIFDNLVFHNTHAGFFHRHLSKRNSHVVCCKSRRFEDLVNLFLGEVGKFLLCRTDFGNQCVNQGSFLCLFHFRGDFGGGFHFLVHFKLLMGCWMIFYYHLMFFFYHLRLIYQRILKIQVENIKFIDIFLSSRKWEAYFLRKISCRMLFFKIFL